MSAQLGNLNLVITRAYPPKDKDFEDGVVAYFSANLMDGDTPVMALNGMQLVLDDSEEYYIRTMRRNLADGRVLSAFTFLPGAEKNQDLRKRQKELYNNTAELIKQKLVEFKHDIEGLFPSK